MLTIPRVMRCAESAGEAKTRLGDGAACPSLVAAENRRHSQGAEAEQATCREAGLTCKPARTLWLALVVKGTDPCLARFHLLFTPEPCNSAQFFPFRSPRSS